MLDTRRQYLQNWLENLFRTKEIRLSALTNDASFRRYFRIHLGAKSLVAMDSPPGREDCRAFIKINHILQKLHIHGPNVISADIEEGFLLLTDMGDRLLLPELTSVKTAEILYKQTFPILLRFHHYKSHRPNYLERFAFEIIQNELNLFTNWFIGQYLQIPLSKNQHQLLTATFTFLKDNAHTQPQVFTHRDFHSRNLMMLNHHDIAVLDFQDALIGPITYDLVSLLKDCYIMWPQEQVERWALAFLDELNQHHPQNYSPAQFLAWFHLMGLQRHLKVLGIFCRLYLRDKKAIYLQHLPRVLNYALITSQQFPELSDFHDFLVNFIQPHFNQIHVSSNAVLSTP